jgi:hypothetical protein
MICPRCGMKMVKGRMAKHRESCDRLPTPDELAEQYSEGYTTRDLSELHGVSQRTLLERLKRSPDYKPRPVGVQCSKLLNMKPEHPCAGCEIDLDHPDVIRVGDKCLYCALEEYQQAKREDRLAWACGMIQATNTTGREA